MKKAIAILAIIALLATSLFAQGASEEKEDGKVTIGISQLLAHPALDSIAKGITDYLDEAGLDYEVDIQLANGEISTCASIAQLFKSKGYDYVVGIATPTAQALANTFQDGTPVIYATVTDPEAAGLDGIDYVCGTTDQPPLEAHLDLIERLSGAKRIGMLYTSIEANGISQMEKMKAACEKRGIEFIPQSVNNSSEVRSGAQTIVDRIDAMYVSTDNTVVSAINGMAEVCTAAGVPLFSADTTSAFGTEVFLAGGFDYYKSGLQTGRMLLDVINGAKPKDLGMEFVTDQELYINLDVASELGIEIPEDMKASAAYLIVNGENTVTK